LAACGQCEQQRDEETLNAHLLSFLKSGIGYFSGLGRDYTFLQAAVRAGRYDLPLP
jgi:hypothetical protein